VTALRRDRSGGLWVATVWPQALGGRGGRVLKADGNRVETELSPYPWPQDTYATCPACLLSDSAGRLWIGSYGSALRYWSVATGWEDIATHGPLARLDATCLAEDRDGAIYVGTAGGVLYQFRSRVVTTVDLPPEAEQNFITASGAGSDGSVWIGTDGAGVFRYRAGKWTRFSADQGLRNSHIGCVFEDRHGRLWVGTWGGLHEFRDDRFEPTPGPEALRQVVLALCDDLHGNLCGRKSSGHNSPPGDTTGVYFGMHFVGRHDGVVGLARFQFVVVIFGKAFDWAVFVTFHKVVIICVAKFR